MNSVHTTSGRWKFGLFLTLTAALFWGMLPTALKVLVNEMDAYTITWYRLVLAFGILLVLLSLNGKLPDLRRIDRRHAFLLAITCVGLCVNYVTYVLGLNIIGPGPAQILIQLNAFFVILGGIFVFRERFVREQLLGLLAIIAGLALFFHNKLAELFTSISDYTIGVVILLLSAAALACYSLAQKQLLTQFSSLQISMLVFGAGAILMLPITAGDITQLFDLEWSGVALLLFCTVTTLLAFGCYAEALQHWETTKISAVLSTVPLIALGFAELTVYLNPGLFTLDPLTMISVIGAVILVIGSWLVARKNN
ncbi:MAG: DMT family transporter [Alphaproteobacteria bacterium]|nr:DMT family transporter [Alphaproteobacteria bacterium]